MLRGGPNHRVSHKKWLEAFVMSRIEYQLQIDHHPSGNLTLKWRKVGRQMWSDLRSEGLFANPDPASFYKAVANYVVLLSSNGHKIVSLADTTDAA